MLRHYKNAKERWGGVHTLVDRWLSKRQRLIVRYYNVLSSKPLNSKKNELAESMSIFCESLMNYCSVSHFQVYERLLASAQHVDTDSLDFAKQTLLKLEEITSDLVDFNDQYGSECSLDKLMQLGHSLSKVGELLEDRFVLEDKLIATLYTRKEKEVSA